jgi:argonaute-like protein implicated in RNA metabolism and viral defense
VGDGGGYIDTRIKKTRFREHLQAEEFQKHLVKVVRQYHERTGQFASTIVIHRDGRMFQSELAGARAGLQQLIDDGFIVANGSLTCVEIAKHSYASLRLFNVQRSNEGRSNSVQNPTVGQYFIPTSSEGYLVATGPPFYRAGTVLPLHVRKLEGPLSMEQILEDIYRLTTLTWSRPEDCTRYPITIKLNDRRLFEDAGQYDEIEIELQEEEAEL